MTKVESQEELVEKFLPSFQSRLDERMSGIDPDSPEGRAERKRFIENHFGIALYHFAQAQKEICADRATTTYFVSFLGEEYEVDRDSILNAPEP